MNTENQLQGGSNSESSKYLGSNILGSFLILLIALTLTIWIIWPALEASFNHAMRTQGTIDWIYVSEGLLVTGFVIAFPLFLIVQAISLYQPAE